LTELHDPKSIKFLREIGGTSGLILGLRTNANQGLSTDESVLRGHIGMEDVLNAARERQLRELSRQDSYSQRSKPSENLSTLSFTSKSRLTGDNVGPNDEQLLHPPSVIRRMSTVTLGGTKRSTFYDRRRIFSVNRIPQRKSKTIFQLMWSIIQDKVLVCTTGISS
jgi:P-type Ca2+ transporter type 2C